MKLIPALEFQCVRKSSEFDQGEIVIRKRKKERCVKVRYGAKRASLDGVRISDLY